MEKQNRLIVVFVTLIALLIGVYFLLRNFAGRPEAHRAVYVTLERLSENNLRLNSIELKTIYPANPIYSAQIAKYYQIKVLAKNDRVLYSTQVPKEYMVSRFTYPGFPISAPVTIPNQNIDLFLPVYSQADKMTIEDEVGNTLMSVNLKSLD